MQGSLFLSCENEQLHLSGAVQPHGALLALTSDGTISHASENIAQYMGFGPRELLRTTFCVPDKLPLAELALVPGSQVRVTGCRIGSDHVAVDVVMTRLPEGGVLLELFGALDVSVRRAMYTGGAAPQRLLEALQTALPYERLLYYQFCPDGDGEVLAEVCINARIGSYLGLRFPASDIPQIARRLYQKNPWRLIPDARLAPVPIIGVTPTPPDLSWSDLRSVSPVHSDYMANMGVVASLSFPVIRQDRLVALVSCHHGQPMLPSLQVLGWASSVVAAYQLELSSAQAKRTHSLVGHLPLGLPAIVAELLAPVETAAWPTVRAVLLDQFAADFVALSRGGVWANTDGVAVALLDEVRAWAVEQPDLVASSDCTLCDILDARTDLCGVLSIAIASSGVTDHLLLFRQAYVHEVAWGGAPNKPVETQAGVQRLGPRRSFERWVETRKDYSRPWSRDNELLALQLRSALQRSLVKAVPRPWSSSR
jgi:two-component system, chemotaxis family, sensor kinase Cph1